MRSPLPRGSTVSSPLSPEPSLVEESMISVSAPELVSEQARQRRQSREEPSKIWWVVINVILLRHRINQALLEAARSRPQSCLARCSSRWLTFISLNISVVTFRCMHALLSLVVFQHFFFIKWRQQEDAVPPNAPNFGLKRFTPPFEFGTMHVRDHDAPTRAERQLTSPRPLPDPRTAPLLTPRTTLASPPPC